MKPKIRTAPGRPLWPLAIDSGAHSLYTRYGAPKTAEGKQIRGEGISDKVNSDYLNLPLFHKYLEDYMTFLLAHGKDLVFSVSVDVMMNPEASWDIWKEMTKQGAKAIPVFHFGEESKWLKKYMDETDYIGIGGLVNIGSKGASEKFRARAWKLLCDDKGKPLVKVHGFGITSFKTISDHPYHSVDSTAAFTWSRYGSIAMPRHAASSGWEYSELPKIVPVTPLRSRDTNHFIHYRPGGVRHKGVLEHLEALGLTIDEVRDEYGARDFANLFFMNHLMRSVSEKHSKRMGAPHTMLYYASGNFASTVDVGLRTVARLDKIKETDHLAYLGTFDKPRPLAMMLNAWQEIQITKKGPSL